MSSHAHSHTGRDHGHDTGHDHEHGHDEAHGALVKGGPTGSFTKGEARQATRLSMVLGLVVVFFGLELAGALAAHSVVLQADAIHLLMDVLVLAMSLLAMRLAVRKPTPRFTFGLRRVEPVAAIFNAILVFIATFEIVREGIDHLEDGEAPRASIMLLVACGALVVNGISAWLLHDAIHHSHGHDHDGHDHDAHDHAHESVKGKQKGHALNLRGAKLHLLGDMLGSLAALAAAIVIRAGGPSVVDAIASFLVAVILVLGAIRLIKDALLVLLEASPPHLSVEAVRSVVLAFDGVASIHDLHVWSLGGGHDAITVHVIAKDADPTVSSRLSKHVRAKFDVEYVTVQVETPAGGCGARPSIPVPGA